MQTNKVNQKQNSTTCIKLATIGDYSVCRYVHLFSNVYLQWVYISTNDHNN